MSQSDLVDFRRDPAGRTLARLAQIYDLPEFVKNADLDQLREHTACGRDAMADVRRGLFNCNTPAATWLSALYYHGHAKAGAYKQAEQAEVESRLGWFVDYWRIRPEYDELVKRAAEVAEAAAAGPPDEDFALVRGSSRVWPLTSPAQVKEAAEQLRAQVDSFTFEERNRAATRIVEKAASYGVTFPENLSEFVDRQAGNGVCNPDDAVRAVRARATLVKSAAVREALTKLASSLEGDKRRFFHPDNLVHLATVLDGVDRANHLTAGYGPAFRRPEDVLFSATFGKAAAELDNRCVLVTDTVYRKEAFAKLALAEVRDLLGDEVAEEVRRGLEVDPEKMAEVAAALPRPDAELLDRMMEECGVPSEILKRSCDMRLGLPDNALNALAADYGV